MVNFISKDTEIIYLKIENFVGFTSVVYQKNSADGFV